MRANAYIDGFNLYYGALKARPGCRWLDLRTLCSRLLPSGFELDEVHYFTARVEHALDDPGRPQRQDVYLRALRGESQPFFYVNGHFQTKTRLLPRTGSGELVAVRLTQEKGSDVNLAARLVSDACEQRMDAALVVTDDFDQAGALTIAREECGVKLIVASPRGRTELAETVRADFRKKINEQLLRECQLPELAIGDDGREIVRPPRWIDPEIGEAAPKSGLLSSSRSS